MLRRKARRDIAARRAQFVSVALMAFLAAFIYSGVGGEWRGLQRSVDEFYAGTNLADAWVLSGGFTDSDVEKVLAVDGVSAVERRTELNATGEGGVSVAYSFVERGELSAPHIVDGAAFDAADADGIWLDKHFFDANGLTLGGEFTASYLGISLTKTIRGTVYSPEYVYMSADFAYLSVKAFPLPQMFTYTTLLIRSDDVSGLEERVSDALGGRYSVFFDRENHQSVAMFANEIAQHKMMGDIFPVVFLLVALLTILTTMTRLVDAQRTQIGTLTALGFSRGAITRHYIGYGLYPSAIGAVAGAVTGPLILPYLFYPAMSSYYTLPVWKPAYHSSFAIVAAATIVLSVAVSFLAARKSLTDTPAAALRPKPPKVARRGVFERLPFFAKLGFNARWNLRDAQANRTRAIMAIVGVFGCTALIVCALGMDDSMDIIKDWQYRRINRFETKLTLEETATDGQIAEILAAVSGENVMEVRVELRAGGVKKSGDAIVGDNLTLRVPTDARRREIALPPDGVSVSQKLAETLGVEVGDEIEWHFFGAVGWTKSVVAALYRSPATQGIWLTRQHLEALGLTFTPTAILSPERVTGDFSGVSEILSSSDIIGDWEELTEAMMIMVYLLIAAAAVLSVVVLYNLGLLSFTEMERDMATLKVMGMKTAKLRRLLLTQNLWFSAVGFVLGVPAGLRLIDVIVTLSGDSFDFPVELTLGTVLLSFVITFGLSVFAGLLFSGRITRLDMVGALKSTE
ncbi:MAG: ABC transporter permease [Oscillospiraceae bacterium]|jgi:putative ABC transport system permease protein|nr:ABC transporter permease [Oscillospiraceae bacterium]